MRTQAALYVSFLFCHALPATAIVTITEDSGKGIMRREKGFEAQSEPIALTEEFVNSVMHVTGGRSPSPTPPPEQICNQDFPLGYNETNDCVNETHHQLILDEGTCEKAAELSGASVEHNFFVIEQDYDELHPQGCFAYHCGSSEKADRKQNGSMCYYYNGNGQDPEGVDGKGTVAGTPVCYRANYLNGTKDTNRCQDEGYTNVMDEVTCRDAAECLGFDKADEFRIGEWNFSKHNEYPKGCFIRTDTGQFQFNNASSLDGEPENPQIGGGIPVCNVSSVIRWPESLSTPAPSINEGATTETTAEDTTADATADASGTADAPAADAALL